MNMIDVCLAHEISKYCAYTIFLYWDKIELVGMDNLEEAKIMQRYNEEV